MRHGEFDRLVTHLTAEGKEVFDENYDLGFPATFEEFVRVMWSDDQDMEDWRATREEYTDALRAAYNTLAPMHEETRQ
jgi:hypothetical protein